jgi:hypothetical protein
MPEPSDVTQRKINSTAARVSLSGAVERCAALPSACKVIIASPPMRSTTPRARRRSVFDAIRSRSVAIS